MQKITPFLWFENNAEDAVNFYTSVFENSKTGKIVRYDKAGAAVSKMQEGTAMTVPFELEGQNFTALNGGPHFKINPSVSFFVNCKTENEVNNLWNKLSDGGTALMPLDKYSFSEKYGWVQDKFGVSWQVILAVGEITQKFIPSLLFVGSLCGKAEEAMNYYTNVFNDSKVKSVFRYQAGMKPDNEGTIAYADFLLGNQIFVVMDSAREHKFAFNEAISFVVNCNNQEEVDYYWNKLSEGGNEKAQMCGWLKDKFGISWQIVPDVLIKLLSGPDPLRSQKVMQAMLQMKKIIIDDLEKAYNG